MVSPEKRLRYFLLTSFTYITFSFFLCLYFICIAISEVKNPMHLLQNILLVFSSLLNVKENHAINKDVDEVRDFQTPQKNVALKVVLISLSLYLISNFYNL